MLALSLPRLQVLFVLGGYQTAMMWLMDASDVIQLIFGAHFVGINLLGMLICYSIEIQHRKSFFLNSFLKEEKKKIGDINRTP
jgi:two-component system cell cycle sensor histidine kinase/response regulator CckA